MKRKRTVREQASIDRINKALPAFCNAEADARGNVRIYFRRKEGSPKLRLKEELFSRAFWQEYEDAKAWPYDSIAWRRRHKGSVKPPARRPAPATTYTLGWLVDEYYNSDAFKTLKKQHVRKLIIANMLNERIDPCDPESPLVREMPLASFDDRDVRALMDRKVRWVSMADPESPDDDDLVKVRKGTEAANSRTKALRAVLGYGFVKHREIVTDQWAHKVQLYASSVEGFHCWTIEEIECFRAIYPVGTKERLAFELLYWTGQRRGDIVRLSRFLLKDDIWEVRQEKNSGTDRATTAHVPMFPELREILLKSAERGIVGESVYLISERGGPYTKESFGNWFRDVCNRAGLPQCSAHGLRKAFVVQMISRRVRPQEIMAITGHRTQKEFDRYARDFLRREAALRVYEDLCREHGFEMRGEARAHREGNGE